MVVYREVVYPGCASRARYYPTLHYPGYTTPGTPLVTVLHSRCAGGVYGKNSSGLRQASRTRARLPCLTTLLRLVPLPRGIWPGKKAA